ITLGNIDTAERGCRIERGEAAGQHCRLGAGDAAAIAGDRDVPQAGMAPFIQYRTPAELRLVPAMRELQAEADLGVGDHPFMQEQMVGGDLAALPRDAFDPPPPECAQPAYAA